MRSFFWHATSRKLPKPLRLQRRSASSGEAWAQMPATARGRRYPRRPGASDVTVCGSPRAGRLPAPEATRERPRTSQLETYRPIYRPIHRGHTWCYNKPFLHRMIEDPKPLTLCLNLHPKPADPCEPGNPNPRTLTPILPAASRRPPKLRPPRPGAAPQMGFFWLRGSVGVYC